ncbi:hypothetical protein Nepgr_008520 [Nepenthes gracilis]|uniref:Protein TONSOKU n=1 Tax=Nepenthes gracilis TaxID=150966 RepID=A0AAD3S8U8_NEPGR|nr:hypothetical protein Nepgr_008520 [Nepenthes gracilis]
MLKDDSQLSAAKRAYRSASEVGNKREEARWANVIGDILKNRGEYVQALKWLRIDFKISSDCLPERDLLPSCQSIGELYLRLQDFENALYYQKEHLRLAKQANDIVEQQRASTQLGRSYHEIFMKYENDHSALHNAKKHFKSAMDLAKILKENPPSNRSSFLKEYIDAHNNIGMLEMDLDNLKEAEKILTKGLQICEEEEVKEDDDGRSRLHHNLGFVYTKLRMWDKAHEHIKKDIVICKKIGHCQGEAKGYINLGELHYSILKYKEAILSYQKALDLAKSMEDEDVLVDQINQNIHIVKEAIEVMNEIKKEEQNLKKLSRSLATARGTSNERKCLLQQMSSLDSLIEKSSMICAWSKHLAFAKMKKRIACEACDKEKLSDSFLVIGESYEKLRNFKKARKWYTRSWETYKLIGNLEGQALTKINIGDALDSDGDWTGALKAFEEGYRIADQANLRSVQLSALENMHYSHMMRFDNFEEARRLQLKINNLKLLINGEIEAQEVDEDCCPETETEGGDDFSDCRSDASGSPEVNELLSTFLFSVEEVKDDEPLISLVRPPKEVGKQKSYLEERDKTLPREIEDSTKSLSKSTSASQTAVGRKRARIVLSDNEEEEHNKVECSRAIPNSFPIEDVCTSHEFIVRPNAAGLAGEYLDASPVASKCAISLCNPANLEESACSYKSSNSGEAAQNDIEMKSPSINESCIRVKVEGLLICFEANSCMIGDELNIEILKAQAACSYYLQLPSEKRTSGLLPIFGHLKCEGRHLTSVITESNRSSMQGEGWIETSINGWVHKRLMKLYVDCCKKLSEVPNMKLLKKLYNLEVSEDEVIMSDCELQDMSIVPLVDALHAHKTISVLDLSHNVLGNGTMEKLKQVFMFSGQKYGGLVLDLHNNLFGPTALFQICECPVLFSRLEVLNISGNRLTDACGSYLATILENCKALYSLKVEHCFITTRTIQKIADALNGGSVLSQLSIGYNNPVSGNSLASLLTKLSSLERFSELNLNGLKLNKLTLDCVCQLARSSCLSGLFLGATNIGCDGALQLTESLFSDNQELVKLDLSYCGLTPKYFDRIKTDVSAFSSVLELNLGGNSIMREGGSLLASLFMNPQCCIKVLILNKCCLGPAGVIQIITALSENNSLQELYLAENIGQDEYDALHHPGHELHEATLNGSQSQRGPDSVQDHHLEAADSDDDAAGVGPPVCRECDICMIDLQRNALPPENQYVKELSMAIGRAMQLQLLDLSSNGFSAPAVDALYDAWSSSLRVGLPHRHTKDQILHLSVQGKHCCGMRPCCRRD